MADLAKLVEELSGLTLLEAAELTKMLEAKWGVSAAAPTVAVAAVAGGAAAVAEPVEEKTEFNVIIKNAGAKKIQVIKAVRVIRADLGLKEAKAVVDEAPSVLLEGVSKEEAADAKAKLEAEGAEVEIK